MPESAKRPAPDIRGAGQPYWKGAREGRLSVPKCQACGEAHWYPRLYCPHCGSDSLVWIDCTGRGTVHTFTVVRQSGHPYFKSRVPYVLAMIDLEEGPRLISNIVDCEIDRVHVGAPVRVSFEAIDDSTGVPLFRLDAGEHTS